jgi:hypothetical protein
LAILGGDNHHIKPVLAAFALVDRQAVRLRRRRSVVGQPPGNGVVRIPPAPTRRRLSLAGAGPWM